MQRVAKGSREIVLHGAVRHLASSMAAAGFGGVLVVGASIVMFTASKIA